MSEIALSRNVAGKSSGSSRAFLWIGLTAWFAGIIFLGSNNFFVARQGTPPLALLTAATAPVIVFLSSVSLSSSFRELALSADLKFGSTVQAWRLGGYSFLILYAYGYLPGYFAWPAAVGDMFIGVTAPWIVAKMSDPGFVQSRTFVAWNVLGILDLLVAVAMGALGSILLGNPSGVFPTTVMSQMPLVLIPTFFVPMFVVLHLVALLQVRQRLH
jgi:hypothetical protein